MHVVVSGIAAFMVPIVHAVVPRVPMGEPARDLVEHLALLGIEHLLELGGRVGEAGQLLRPCSGAVGGGACPGCGIGVGRQPIR
ncbi:MAG TPA: hypothetical protein VF229_07450, partial [Burkholderiaceae bacterium]